ncbi:hypothetical protein VQ042_05565 [Aurantimonas sp. A2-1-M11]|uniref:hypothetical protein n=1 Tax=Aurantimonas sp. A2-1-M11 TaxID=3113712 RepID=UPI002F95EDBC
MSASGPAFSDAGRNKAAAETSSDRIGLLGGTLFVLSILFFGAVNAISSLDPGYFDRLLLSAMRSDEIDPIETGSTDKEGGTGVPAMPVSAVVRTKPLTPEDFQIIMVFQSEAHLASPDELWRVRVGSQVPGLGKILAIESGSNGGTVKTENATLTGVPK